MKRIINESRFKDYAVNMYSYCKAFNEYALPVLTVFGYVSPDDILRFAKDGMNFKKLFDRIEEAPAFRDMDPRLARTAADETVKRECNTRPLRTRSLAPGVVAKYLTPSLRLPVSPWAPFSLIMVDGRLSYNEDAIRDICTMTVRGSKEHIINEARKFCDEVNKWKDDEENEINLNKIFFRDNGGMWRVKE